MKQHDDNKIAWNEAALYYKQEIQKSVDFLRTGGKHFCPPEFNFLQDLKSWCQLAIHLQCAGGTDTLSLLNHGAHKVIGIDISDQMIEVAQEKTRQLQMNAEWICSDVLAAPSHVDHTADLVYSGRGAICWIMDIQAWAQVVHRLLKPGGKFYLFEGHPITLMFDMESPTLAFDPKFEGYFSNKIYQDQGWPETYVGNFGKAKDQLAIKHERAWRISSVINALLSTGLKLLRFEEHPDEFWKEFPHLPKQEREKFPNTFSIFMEK